jgi:hypothetical protein
MATAATVNGTVNGNHDLPTYHQVPETQYDRK